MKIKNKPNLKYLDIKIVVLLAVILVNCLRFFEYPVLSRFIPGPNSPPSEEYRALHRFNTDDFKTLAMDVDSINDTHNIYAILGQHEPAFNLIIDSGSTGKIQTDILARIAGLGRVSSIETREIDDKKLNNVLISKSFDVREGAVWEWPGHARAGSPGIEWTFIYDHTSSKDIFLIVKGTKNSPKLIFIDGSVIDNSTTRSSNK